MSAMLELHREMLERRNLAVLGTIMQTQRASVLEKQAAEVAFLRIELDRTDRDLDRAWYESAEFEDQVDALQKDNDELRAVVAHALAEQQRVNGNLKELVDSYWAIVNDCSDVCGERNENARGQKRKLPAAGQMKKINKIILEHIGNRARMVGNAVPVVSHGLLVVANNGEDDSEESDSE